jgi:hypothetical protein
VKIPCHFFSFVERVTRAACCEIAAEFVRIVNRTVDAFYYAYFKPSKPYL